MEETGNRGASRRTPTERTAPRRRKQSRKEKRRTVPRQTVNRNRTEYERAIRTSQAPHVRFFFSNCWQSAQGRALGSAPYQGGARFNLKFPRPNSRERHGSEYGFRRREACFATKQRRWPASTGRRRSIQREPDRGGRHRETVRPGPSPGSGARPPRGPAARRGEASVKGTGAYIDENRWFG